MKINFKNIFAGKNKIAYVCKQNNTKTQKDEKKIHYQISA
ncbi:hypothetical protein M2373_004342 [Chryseobacterium sp. JUb7]|nr:hypothetical protein [Chryseobacterium sp. JUb7]